MFSGFLKSKPTTTSQYFLLVKPPCLPHHKKNCETGHGHCPKHCDHHSGGSGGGGKKIY